MSGDDPIRLAYVDTSQGQVHARSLGEGQPIVLLHWAPASGQMYEPVIRALAGMGRRGIALDLPGFGRSFKPAVAPSIPQMAEIVGEAIEAMELTGVVLVGGHLSSGVAIEIARSKPGRIGHLVLDGVMALTGSEMAQLMQGFAGLSPRLDVGGRHSEFIFRMVHNTLREWNPDFVLNDQTMGQVYGLANDYLEMGLAAITEFVEPTHEQAVYPCLGRLAQVRQPTLLLSAEREPLRAAFGRAQAAKPNATAYTFPGTHPLMSVDRASEYAIQIAAFGG